MSDLPFGLKAYQPLEFATVHGPGSGKLTASQVPALFGHSRFAGRYAIAAHIAGKRPLDFADSPLMARGRRLEPIAAEMLEERGYYVWDQPEGGIYAEHPSIKNFLASPDRVATHSDTGNLLVEFKVVADFVHKDKWSDGPPLEVELQHQAQFACCQDALFGVIAALVVGSFRFDLVIHETSRNNQAVKLIEDAARDLLSTLANGLLPEPDSHESAAAVLQALHPVDPSREIVLEGEQLKEAALRFEGWRACSKLKREAEKTEKEHKAWFSALAKDASRVLIGNDRRIEIKDIHKKGYEVQPTSYRQLRLIQESEE